MKTLVEVKEVAEEGFLALLGKNVEVFCGNYIYAGKLVGVNASVIKLGNPYLVYETGAFTEKNYKDAQSMKKDFQYISVAFVESFGETTKL